MRRRIIIGGVVLALLGGAVAMLPSVGTWYIRTRLVPLLEKRLDRRLEIRRVELSARELTLHEVRLLGSRDPAGGALAFIPRITVDYRLAGLLGGRLESRLVVLHQPMLQLVRRADGSTNFLDLVERRNAGAGGGRMRIEAVRLEGGRLTLQDEQLRVTVSAGGIKGQLASGAESVVRLGPMRVGTSRSSDLSFAEIELALRWSGRRLLELPRVKLSGGRVRLLPHFELSGVGGTIGPDGARLAIQLEGSYGGSDAKLWSALGWVDPPKRGGKLTIKAARFSLGRVASVLQHSPVITPERTTIDGVLDLGLDRGVLRFAGGLEVHGLSLFHPALARAPVLDLSGGVKLDGRLELDAAKLVLDQLDLHSQGVDAQLSGTVERLGSEPRVSMRLRVPPVPCQAVLTAFPPSLLPQLQGFQLKGTFAVDLQTEVDYHQLDQLKLGGRVGIQQCKVVAAPEETNAETLLGPFEHQVEPTPGQTQTFTVGPEGPDFVPYAEISPAVVNAVLTTEDAGFFRHHGFIPSQFRTALSRNLQKGGFRLGASTITMQTVKNVLLTQEKTLSRKLQELFLTWYLEQVLPKERTMEIYLNVIEFGPNIYGIGAAAQHYFGKSAKELTPLEAAFFASILPSPKRRYVQYCRGELSPTWDRYVRRLLKRMSEKGFVDAAGMEEAASQSIVFARNKDELSEEDCYKQVNDLLEAWHEEDRRRLREAVLQSAPHQVDLYLTPATARNP